MTLDDIRVKLEEQLNTSLKRCGLMFRIFSRAKTVRSLKHKMDIKGDKYRKGDKIQDVIGLRIVLYFPDDVDLLGFFFSCNNLVKASIDNPNVDTFRPQRLNITKRLPKEFEADFRSALPEEYAQYIDSTYEVQIRTIFSEGWHEVEHDMRYKCQDDWIGYGKESRNLNGLIATLETAEWSMATIFEGLANKNYERGEYKAMLRNKLRIRLADDNFSPKVQNFLATNKDVARQLLESDRMVLLIALLNHEKTLPLTYDNILFLINRIDIMNEELQNLESEETLNLINEFMLS